MADKLAREKLLLLQQLKEIEQLETQNDITEGRLGASNDNVGV